MPEELKAPSFTERLVNTNSVLAMQLSKRSRAVYDFYSGDLSEEVTPVPIPNTAVKLFSG